MKPVKVKELALKISEGLLATVTDLLLFQFYLIGASVGKSKTSRDAYLMLDEATQDFRSVNYQTIKQTFAYLKRKGLIRSLLEPVITEEGKKRLAAVVPQYIEKRTWDKVLYLITYDIPETKRKWRDKLRLTLKSLGAGCLQASVWITPYNPQKILQDFSQRLGFEGEIIISCIGKDGYIGTESIQELIQRVYRLEEINGEYLQFLEKYGNNKISKKDKWRAAVSYLSILGRDPQLPLALLVKDWAGDRAQARFVNI